MVTAGDGHIYSTASSSRRESESHLKCHALKWVVGDGTDYLPTAALHGR